ncbi:hypothetical protein ACQKGC_05935 [Allorhizobium pseudoryzae]|uniref:hypothetical protein n=1 Tax=Allorhizobium pseudoryzae TaxID=379684 RepID=UPI003CFD8D32
MNMTLPESRVHRMRIAAANCLKRRFILSLNAVLGVFETSSKFSIEEVDCSYSIQRQGRAKEVKEVVISGPAK